MEDKLTFLDLIHGLYFLNEGVYTKETNEGVIEISINKSSTNQYMDTYNISIQKNDKAYYDIVMRKNKTKGSQFPYSVDGEINFIKEKYSLFFETINNTLTTDYISKTIKNKTYEIYNDRIFAVKDEKCEYYEITDNGISKELDSRSELEYDFCDKEYYIYYKKHNNKTVYYTKDNSVKFVVNNHLEEEISRYNRMLEEAYNIIYDNLNMPEFKALLDSFDLSLLNDKFYLKSKELAEVVDIYNKFQPKFKEYKNEIFDEVAEFIIYLINNPEQAMINRFKNSVMNEDLHDINTLKMLQKELKRVRMYKKIANIEKIKQNIENSKMLILMPEGEKDE